MHRDTHIQSLKQPKKWIIDLVSVVYLLCISFCFNNWIKSMMNTMKWYSFPIVCVSFKFVIPFATNIDQTTRSTEDHRNLWKYAKDNKMYFECNMKTTINEMCFFLFCMLQLPDGSRVSGFCKDGKLIETMYEDVHTLYEAIKRGAKVSSNALICYWKNMESKILKVLSDWWRQKTYVSVLSLCSW